jgi:hypothetical protein
MSLEIPMHSARIPPIYYCLPLKSRAVAKDWNHVCRLLEDTLAAIFASDIDDIKVLIACHDVPVTRFSGDSRLEYLPIGHTVPVSVAEQTNDKQIKLRMLAEAVCQAGGGYMVLMDADDLVSRHLARFIRNDDNRLGYSIQQGYIWNIQRGYFYKVNDFPRHCGSCSVFYLEPKDLMNGAEGLIQGIYTTSHTNLAGMSESKGRPLSSVPFPAMIYLRHHGENFSIRSRPSHRLTRLRNHIVRLWRLIWPRTLPSRDVSMEFVINDSYFLQR